MAALIYMAVLAILALALIAYFRGTLDTALGELVK